MTKSCVYQRNQSHLKYRGLVDPGKENFEIYPTKFPKISTFPGKLTTRFYLSKQIAEKFRFFQAKISE